MGYCECLESVFLLPLNIGMVKHDSGRNMPPVYISDVQSLNIKPNNVAGNEERLYKRRGKTDCVCSGSGECVRHC